MRETDSLDARPTEGGAGLPFPDPAGDFDLDNRATEGGADDGILGRIDRYELRARLGGGGFGSVFLAYDTVAKIQVAVKGLPPLIRHVPEELERVRENFALVQRLRHPHIAGLQVLHRAEKVWYAADEVGAQLRVDKGDYLLVMEYVPGVTLSQWRRQFPGGKVPVAQAVEVVRQAAAALDYAHSQKIVHRDVKPSNLMVETRITDVAGGIPASRENMVETRIADVAGGIPASRENAPARRAEAGNCRGQSGSPPSTSLTVKVLDFGLAAEIRSSMSRVSKESGDTSGTRPYMAPEQWAGRKQAGHTDQYALAVLFHELVAGSVPFASAFETGDPVIMMAAAERRLPDPLPELSKRQNAALLAALAKDPAGRFPTCGEFVDSLEGKTTKHTKGGGLWKWAAALALLALLAAGGWWVWRSRPTTVPPPASSTSHSQSGQPGQLGQSGQQAPPTAPRAPGSELIPFRFGITPAGAALTLTHDTLGLVADKTIPDGGRLLLDLAPGTYHALVTAPGHRTVQQDVEVSADSAEWMLKLSERRGDLTVRSQSGVSVTVKGADGRAVPFGKTNAQGELKISTLKEGDYTVELSLADHRAESAPVSLVEGKAVELKRQLAPLPGRIKIGGRANLDVWGLETPGSGVVTRLGAANEWIALPAGEHALELRCRGFRTERISLTIPPNRDIVRAAPDLAAESGAIRVEATVPAAARDHFAGIDKRLRVGTGEWKTVRALPHTEDGLACEEHQIRLEAPGYTVEPATRQATVRDGQTATASFTLSPKPGTATVTANVAGAEVFAADGTRLGKAGDKLSLAPFAEHRLTVKAPGHKPATATVRIPHPEADAGTTRVTLEEVKVPTWRLVALVDGREVPATITIGNQTHTAPRTFTLEDGKRYTAAFIYEAGGKRYRAEPVTVTADWKGERERRVTLEEVRGPAAGANGRIDDLGLDLVWVAPGSFRMGSDDGFSDEKPVREVHISRGFWLGKVEVKQSEYEALMGTNPSNWKGADLPVEQVSWNDAVEFCRKLTQRERAAGRLPDGYVYRLPTEAEWEYAARGGAKSGGFTYAGSNIIGEVAWYTSNSGNKTNPVGRKKPNELGLYDMSGNVWEWCHDWYQSSYSGLGNTDPSGPAAGSNRVGRGGGWGSDASGCRSARRGNGAPARTNGDLGFRVSLAPPVQ